MSAGVRVRRYRPGEEPALFHVYHSSIHVLAAAWYSAQQIEAWAPREVDPALWEKRIRGIDPFVAEMDGQIVAYADVQANGYIDHFFVAGAFARRGLGTLLMNRLVDEAQSLALPHMTSDVSRAAQGFFERFGFAVVEQRNPVVRGVVVPNARMRRALKTA